jgi:hypothetical protein
LQGRTNTPPVFFLPKNGFFRLLSGGGGNKKIEIFSKRLFEWCKYSRE